MNKKDYIIPIQYPNKQSYLNKSRQDKFLLVLNLPISLMESKGFARNNKKLDFNSLQFTIYGSPVPDISVPNIEQMYAGQTLKISSHTRDPYENVTVSFNVDNLYRNWWVIYFWLNLLNDEAQSFYDEDNLGDNEAWEAMKDYTATFTIYGLDEYENPVIQYDYEGCFPVGLASPKYDHQDPNEIKSSFTFAFTFFNATLV